MSLSSGTNAKFRMLQTMTDSCSHLLTYLLSRPTAVDSKYKSVWLGLGSVSCLTLLYLAYRRKRHKSKLIKKLDINHQSEALDGPERVHICTWPQAGQNLMLSMDDSITTLYDLFLHGHQQDKDADCLGYRPGPNEPYKWLSYDLVLQKAITTGAGLLRLGLKPGKILRR